MSQDTVANFLFSIKNAYGAGRRQVRTPYSSFNLKLAKILVKEGYLTKVKKVLVRKNIAELEVELNDLRGKKGKIINNIKRLSKLGICRYVSVEELSWHNRRLGIVIISTPKGLMTAKEAVKKNLGGELICRIW
ncbi:MAG: uS8 family ribosomal protein [Patescibacteria group bacterium]|jgi:small subunit ribosomal protein S8